MAIPAGIKLAATLTSGIIFVAGTLDGPQAGCEAAPPRRPAAGQTHKPHNAQPAKPVAHGPESAPAPTGGTVYSRSTGHHPRVCATLDAPGQDGRRGCTDTTLAAAKRCFIGAVWPSCRNNKHYGE
jgi:hypothetical protein